MFNTLLPSRVSSATIIGGGKRISNMLASPQLDSTDLLLSAKNDSFSFKFGKDRLIEEDAEAVEAVGADKEPESDYWVDVRNSLDWRH